MNLKLLQLPENLQRARIEIITKMKKKTRAITQMKKKSQIDMKLKNLMNSKMKNTSNLKWSPLD